MTSKQNYFTFLDLFAGIGGFRIALEASGGVFSSEINSQCRHYKNFGELPFGDIKKIDLFSAPPRTKIFYVLVFLANLLVLQVRKKD